MHRVLSVGMCVDHRGFRQVHLVVALKHVFRNGWG